MQNIFDDYRSLTVQTLHKEGLTNFNIKVEEPSQEMHQCQIIIFDNLTGCKFELFVVRGEKDILAMMPSIIKLIKEKRNEKRLVN